MTTLLPEVILSVHVIPSKRATVLMAELLHRIVTHECDVDTFWNENIRIVAVTWLHRCYSIMLQQVFPHTHTQYSLIFQYDDNVYFCVLSTRLYAIFNIAMAIDPVLRIVLYCIVLYCIVLYCTVLYCIVCMLILPQ